MTASGPEPERVETAAAHASIGPEVECANVEPFGAAVFHMPDLQSRQSMLLFQGTMMEKKTNRLNVSFLANSRPQ